jgi:site-specific DNA-methyltransferase (adenine-specific)
MNLIQGDCLEQLKLLGENTFDSLITDPPAGISFMGKAWDHDHGGRDTWQAWMADIMKECLRVMKPGAHGLVWAIPRTSHWTATALEDAGFEIRDVVTHLFGSGFPKSMNISIAIDKQAGAMSARGKAFVTAGRGDRADIQDQNGKAMPSHDAITPEAKQWQGWGTALKPASEHWILVRKPLSEKTVAANALKWGVGGINIDASRIASGDQEALFKNWYKKQGRFPANLVLTCCGIEPHDDTCAVAMLDEQSGVSKSQGGGKKSGIKYGTIMGKVSDKDIGDEGYYGDTGGASRFFYCAKASKADKNAGCDLSHSKAVGNRPNGGDLPYQVGLPVSSNTLASAAIFASKASCFSVGVFCKSFAN